MIILKIWVDYICKKNFKDIMTLNYTISKKFTKFGCDEVIIV